MNKIKVLNDGQRLPPDVQTYSGLVEIVASAPATIHIRRFRGRWDVVRKDGNIAATGYSLGEAIYKLRKIEGI